MNAPGPGPNSLGWWASILTDIHFWIPVAVLMGGLLLVRFMR